MNDEEKDSYLPSQIFQDEFW